MTTALCDYYPWQGEQMPSKDLLGVLCGAFEFSPIPTVVTADAEGPVLGVNRQFVELFGYGPEEIRNVSDWWPRAYPDLEYQQQVREQWSQHARTAAREGRPIQPVEAQVRCKDGSVRYCSFHLHATHGLSIISMVDLTEREQARASLEQSAAQVAGALQATVNALAATTELRDPYTAGHQRRVAQLAVAVAEELQWREASAETMYVAGLLHDIGKIVVPSEILAKPGRLSEAEFGLVRRHAEVGASILAEIDFGDPVADMVRQHHERLDGSGYPRGLHGPDILPGARILAVADVFEAMQSHRPYRPALGSDAALDFISANAGTLFDAEVVAVCEDIVREGFELLP